MEDVVVVEVEDVQKLLQKLLFLHTTMTIIKTNIL